MESETPNPHGKWASATRGWEMDRKQKSKNKRDGLPPQWERGSTRHCATHSKIFRVELIGGNVLPEKDGKWVGVIQTTLYRLPSILLRVLMRAPGMTQDEGIADGKSKSWEWGRRH